MPDAILPPDDLKQAVVTSVGDVATSFVQLMRSLPQLRGTDDLAVTPGCILWRGLSTEGVAALIDKGADPNARERIYGQTPLVFAAENNRAQTITLLTTKRARVALTPATVEDARSLVARWPDLGAGDEGARRVRALDRSERDDEGTSQGADGSEVADAGDDDPTNKTQLPEE